MDKEPKNGLHTQRPTKVCRKCKSVESVDQAFCSSCGEPLKGAMKKNRAHSHSTGSALGSLVDGQHRKHIKHAGIAILVVAGVTIFLAIFQYYMLDREIEKVEADPRQYVKQEIVDEIRLQIKVTFALGCVFFLLFLWGRYNPFGATLTALIIYITSTIAAAGIDPKNLAKGIVVKIIIIMILAKGVKSGLAYRKGR